MLNLPRSLGAAIGAIALLGGGVAHAAAPVQLTVADTYATGLGEGSAEIVAHDGDHVFVINTGGTALDLLRLGPDGTLTPIRRVDLGAYGTGGNGVAASNGMVAVALDGPDRAAPGTVVLLDRLGKVRATVTVGAVPDMVTFTPDGRQVLVANEGEPDDDYAVDPEGSVSIIDVARALGRPSRNPVVRTAGFRGVPVPPGVRIFGPGATPAQDLEPEYIAVDPDGALAYVTLQENNAIAVVDIRSARVLRIMPLGLKDHRSAGNGLDASDRDGITIATAEVPLKGMYQPDAIATFRTGGRTYLITANEGDVREWGAYEEGERAGELTDRLDPTAFPSGLPSRLRRLTVSTASGDTDGDGDFDELHAFGARSFSIWTTDGALVFDSGDQLERIVAAQAPTGFNVSNSNNTVDNRSDDKGPEPEGVTVADVNGRLLAFITLERVGGVIVYDVTNPSAPTFQSWANNRDFAGSEVGPDSGPEGVTVVPATTTRAPLVLVGNEVSGTVTSFRVDGVPSPRR